MSVAAGRVVLARTDARLDSTSIGGGGGQSTYAALCDADGKEVQFARGINDQAMQNAAWDLEPYVGKKMFIKVVDASTNGWGHVTVDDVQFDAKVLTKYPESLSMP